MAKIFGAAVLLGAMWTMGLVFLWRQRAWRALVAFVVLMTLGSVMTVTLTASAGLAVFPWTRWLTTIFEPVARLLFGPALQQ